MGAFWARSVVSCVADLPEAEENRDPVVIHIRGVRERAARHVREALPLAAQRALPEVVLDSQAERAAVLTLRDERILALAVVGARLGVSGEQIGRAHV